MTVFARFLQDLRRLAVFAIGLGLVAAVGYLVVVQVQAQVALQRSALRQAAYDSERRASALAYFFSEQKDFIRNLAGNRALAGYFENQALGMSLEYGLQASLLGVDEQLAQARQAKLLGGRPLYERLAFVDSHGRFLNDTGPVGSRDGRAFLDPGRAEPGILCDRTGPVPKIILSAPCFFKGAYAGQILGWIGFPRIYRFFFEGDREASRFPDAILLGREFLHVPEPARALVPATLPADLKPGGIFPLAAAGQGPAPHAVVVPVRDTPFALMTFIPASEQLDFRSPRQLLATAGGLALFCVAGMFALVRLSTRNAMLGISLQETLEREQAMDAKNRELAAEIRNRQQAEAERAKLSAQLQQAQKMESVGRLAGGVAHDFNNMLGVILGHTDLAMERLDPSQAAHGNLEEIHKAASRSAELTRQLLAFAHKQTVLPRTLRLNDTVAGMLKMLQRLIGENIEIVWRPGGELWPVRMDPSQVDQIMANLAANARDAIAGVGALTIATRNRPVPEGAAPPLPVMPPGDYVELAVADDGIGMDAETLANIFEPFYTTKGVGKGTGLGLAMIYGIVKQNSGFIEVESAPGQGSTFRIYLPRHPGEDDPAPAPPAPAAARPGHETVLLVEDEPELLELTRQLVAAQGYTVLTAESPSEAIRLAGEHPGTIQLLMTDVVMPEMNGWDLAGALQASHPGLRCLFTSGYTRDVIARNGVLADGLQFLQKPYTKQILLTKVREVLDAKYTGA